MNDKNYIVEQSAIGDLLIFISFLRDNYLDTPINVDINRNSINTWREHPEEYYDFAQSVIEFIAPENISFKKNLSGKIINIEQIKNMYLFNKKEFPLLDLRNKFSLEKDTSSIVLTTKVRYLKRIFFDKIKLDFFRLINNSDKNLIVVGERILEYGKEYTIHGNQTIYSIYDDIIKEIKPEKIIDKTIAAAGITTPDFFHLLEDLKMISKYKVLGFGIPGINFLYSSITDFVGYCEPHDFLPFIDRNRKIFKTKEDFLTITKKYLE